MSIYNAVPMPQDGTFWVLIPKFDDGTRYVSHELFPTKEMAEARAAGMAPGCDPIVAHFLLVKRVLVEYER